MSGPTDRSLDETLMSTALEGRPRRPSAVAELVRGALIGRYVVLTKLGVGAMGVVYMAHDPELDRKVALKLLRADEGDRAGSLGDPGARLLREARGLARLAHPNVVAIHDVGEHDGSVYLAMEFVEGVTFTEWLRARPREWREVLPVLKAVGLGLAAAHDKGLLHRDIKPDNVMVGGDGRVRLMDFGLVRGGRDAFSGETMASSSLAHVQLDATRAGNLLGTPAYMAPEQFRGDELGPAADQFAFCVAAWQALHGERPFAGETIVELANNVLDGKLRPPPTRTTVPGWLRATLKRGLEAEATARWGSMAELLAAFDRGQSRRRIRVVVGGVVIVALLVAGAEGVRRGQNASRRTACELAGAEIDGVWNDDARGRVREGLVGTGVAAADVTADKLMPWLDAHAEGWRAARTEACSASTIEHTLDDAARDKALWCLEDGRLELEMFVEGLVHPEALAVHRAVNRATTLSLPIRCIQPELLASMPTLPVQRARAQAGEIRADLARAATGRSGGELEAEFALVHSALDSAQALDYRPLVAAARLLEGQLSVAAGHAAQAEPSLVDAYFEASEFGAWEIAARAATELTYVVGDRLARPAEGKHWARHAELALAHGGDALGLQEAHRLTNLAVVHHAGGEDDEARRLHERVLQMRERELGPDHPDVAATLTNLANLHGTQGEYDEARRLYERALAIHEQALGSVHPEVANAVGNLAGAFYQSGEYERARRLYERALAIQEQSLGSFHPHLAITIANLANLHTAQGEYDRAKEAFGRALAIQEKSLGPDHPNTGTVLNNLGRAGLKSGDYAQARTHLDRALRLREKAFGPDHPHVATTLTNLALLDIAEGEHDRAQARLDRALAIRSKHGPEHPHVAYTLDALATLALARRRPSDAIPHAERAVRVREAAKVGAELIAASQFLLARALADAPVGEGRDQERALELAMRARDGMRNGPPEERREVAQWLARAQPHATD